MLQHNGFQGLCGGPVVGGGAVKGGLRPDFFRCGAVGIQQIARRPLRLVDAHGQAGDLLAQGNGLGLHRQVQVAAAGLPVEIVRGLVQDRLAFRRVAPVTGAAPEHQGIHPIGQQLVDIGLPVQAPVCRGLVQHPGALIVHRGDGIFQVGLRIQPLGREKVPVTLVCNIVHPDIDGQRIGKAVVLQSLRQVKIPIVLPGKLEEAAVQLIFGHQNCLPGFTEIDAPGDPLGLQQLRVQRFRVRPLQIAVYIIIAYPGGSVHRLGQV